MGIFSGEDVYQFEVATAKMVDTDVDPIKDAVLTAVMVEEDIPSYILATMMNSISIKAKRYLKYGRDSYIYGLPESSMIGMSLDLDALDAAITLEQGEDVTILNGFASPVNINYHAYEFLQDEYNWRFSVNELELERWPGMTFFVRDIFIRPESPDRITIQCEEIIGYAGDPIIWNISTPYPQKDLYYYGVFYLDSETSDDLQYWTYDPTLGTYPDLVITDTGFDGVFYPIAPIRVDKEWVEDDPEVDDDTDPWETTRKLLKKVTLNIPDIREAIEEEQDADDIKNLNDIFFLFAVDIYSEQEETYEYLYKFFDKLVPLSTVTQLQYEAEKAAIPDLGNPPSANTFTISEEQLDVVIEYNYMTKETITGTLENDYEKEIVFNYESTYEFIDITIDPNTGEEIETVRKFTEQNSTITVRKDNKDGTYTEILMHGPKHISIVTALGVRVRIYRTIDEDFIRPDNKTVDEWDKYGQSGFYFPVDFTVMETLSLRDQMYALMDSMLLVIHAAAKEHLEWYETSIFRALLQFVMIVINVILFIPTLGSNLKISAVLWKLFLALALPKLINLVLEYLVKALGKDAAILIAAFFVFSLFKGFGTTLKGLPTALDLLDVTKALNKGLSAYGQIQTIGQQLNLEEMQEAEKELQEAEALLNQDGYQPLYAIQALIWTDPKEDPEDYYNRTIHTANPGVLSLEMIPTFVERSLLLPKVGEVGKSIIV